jgi:prepilin-type processing-associated H-X9-DG protein
MIVESSGRPIFYKNGSPAKKPNDTSPGAVTENITGAGWADPENWFVVHEHCGTNMINCQNDNEIYSFHSGGANFAMGDGAVRFIREDIEPELFVSLMTRAGEDTVDREF